VDMRMLAHRPVLLTNVTGIIAGFAMFGSFVLVPNFVETPKGLPDSVRHLVDYGFDASATKAGLYQLPSSFTLLFAGPLAGLIAVMRTVAGVVGGQVGVAWLSAHTLPGTGGVPSVTGFTVAFAISAVAATIGAGVAVFVTPPRLRRSERLVVAPPEAGD